MAIASGGQVLSFPQAYQGILPLHVPAVIPQPTYHGPLRFPGASRSMDHIIAVRAYIKTATVKDLAAERVRRVEGQRQVIQRETWRISEESGEEKVVSGEKTCKGYVFGREFLTPKQADEVDEGWDVGGERKGIRVDRFIRQDQVRLHWLVGATTVIQPEGREEASDQGIWSTFIDGMIQERVVGMGQYTRQDWEMTRTGLFFPWTQGQEKQLYFIQVSTPFPSVARCLMMGKGVGLTGHFHGSCGVGWDRSG